MAIKESNKRIVITLDKVLVQTIRENATKNERTISKEISQIIEDYYNSKRG